MERPGPAVYILGVPRRAGICFPCTALYCYNYSLQLLIYAEC